MEDCSRSNLLKLINKHIYSKNSPAISSSEKWLPTLPRAAFVHGERIKNCIHWVFYQTEDHPNKTSTQEALTILSLFNMKYFMKHSQILCNNPSFYFSLKEEWAILKFILLMSRKNLHTLWFLFLFLWLLYMCMCVKLFLMWSVYSYHLSVLDLIWLLWFNILCISLHVGFISTCYDDYKAFNMIYNKFLNNLVIKVFFL